MNEFITHTHIQTHFTKKNQQLIQTIHTISCATLELVKSVVYLVSRLETIFSYVTLPSPLLQICAVNIWLINNNNNNNKSFNQQKIKHFLVINAQLFFINIGECHFLKMIPSVKILKAAKNDTRGTMMAMFIVLMIHRNEVTVHSVGNRKHY